VLPEKPRPPAKMRTSSAPMLRSARRVWNPVAGWLNVACQVLSPLGAIGSRSSRSKWLKTSAAASSDWRWGEPGVKKSL